MGIFGIFKKKTKPTTSVPTQTNTITKTADQGQQSSLSNPTLPANTSTANYDINSPIRSGGGKTYNPQEQSTILTPTPSAQVNQNIRQENTLVQNSNRNVQTTQSIATQRELRKIERQERRDLRRNKPYVDIQRNQGTQRDYEVKTYEDIKRDIQRNKNVLTADTTYLTSTTSNVNKVVNNIDVISKENKVVVDKIDEIDKQLQVYDKYIKEDKFVGDKDVYEAYKDLSKSREKEYNKYLDLQSKYDIETQKLKALGGKIDEQGYIKEPTIGVGFFNERQEPISKYSKVTNPYNAVGTSMDIVGESIFSTVGSGIKKVIENVGESYFGKTLTYKEGEGSIAIISEKKAYRPSQGTMQYFGKQGEQPSPYVEYTTPAVTSKDVGNIIYKGGSGAVSLGKYAIPYLGAGIFASETAGRVQESGGVKSYIKEHPVEAGITGGIILTAGVLKGISYLTEVTGKEIEGGVRYSTRGQNIFGTKIRILGARAGEEYYPLNLFNKKLKFEVLPSERYKYQIVRKELVPSKSRDFLGIIAKPELQTEALGETTTYYDIFGNARNIKKGYKTIVQTRSGRKIRISGAEEGEKYYSPNLLNKKLRFEVLPNEKTLFSGLNPYVKLSKGAYKRELEQTIEYLKKQGWKEKEIKKALRLRQPQVIENVFLGKGKVIQTEDKTISELFGTLKAQPISIITEGIPSRLGRGQIDFIKIVGEPVEGGKEGIQLFKGLETRKKAYLTNRGYPYNKLIQQGKTSELDFILSGSKEVEPKELPSVKLRLVKNKKGIYTLELESPRLEYLSGKDFTAYKEGSLSKTIIPNIRQPQLSKGIVLMEKGEPIFKVTDETIKKLYGVQGRGQKSSEQFLKELYSPEEQRQALVSSLFSVQNKIPEMNQPIIKSIQILETKNEVPIINVGRSLNFFVNRQKEEELGKINIQGRMEEAVIDVFTTKNKAITKTAIKGKGKEESKFNLGFGEKSEVTPKESFSFKEEQAQKQQLKQQLKQQQLQKLAQALKIEQRFKQPPIKTTPKIKIPFKLNLPSPSSNQGKTKEDLFGDFKVFVTKKGKENVLEDTFGTLGEAKGKLKQELISTLRAGGGIYRGGKKLSFEDIGLTDLEFRPSKRNPFLVIEKKQKRLRKGGTGRQIQVFR